METAKANKQITRTRKTAGLSTMDPYSSPICFSTKRRSLLFILIFEDLRDETRIHEVRIHVVRSCNHARCTDPASSLSQAKLCEWKT